MSRSYDKIPRGGKAKTAPSADRLVIDIKDRHTLEQFSFELQKLIAKLQEHGVYGIKDCTVYLKTLDEQAERIALWDAKGEPISRLQMNIVASPSAISRRSTVKTQVFWVAEATA